LLSKAMIKYLSDVLTPNEESQQAIEKS